MVCGGAKGYPTQIISVQLENVYLGYMRRYLSFLSVKVWFQYSAHIIFLSHIEHLNAGWGPNSLMQVIDE